MPRRLSDVKFVKAVQVKPILYSNLSKELHNNRVKENVLVEVAHVDANI